MQHCYRCFEPRTSNLQTLDVRPIGRIAGETQDITRKRIDILRADTGRKIIQS